MSNDIDNEITPAMRQALAAAGRLGGRSATDAKVAAARSNVAIARAARTLKPLSAFGSGQNTPTR